SELGTASLRIASRRAELSRAAVGAGDRKRGRRRPRGALEVAGLFQDRPLKNTHRRVRRASARLRQGARPPFGGTYGA
ncbi:MAG: hypothetical protein M1553_08400, partial [Firmicutes bacterium]|nr:hypothetical protein [Bacillota bacterium]